MPSSDHSLSDSDSESDSSWQSFSPITSDDDDDFSVSSSSGDEESISHTDDEPSPAPPNTTPQHMGSSGNLYHRSRHQQQGMLRVNALPVTCRCFYRLCELDKVVIICTDNVDFTILCPCRQPCQVPPMW